MSQTMQVRSGLGVPETADKRVVIAGGGFGGLEVAKRLKNSGYQVVLIDKHNYHQFQPLFYQVAMCGLEPSSISFPLRKVFHKAKNIHFRTAGILSVDTSNKLLIAEEGSIRYDYLILAMGAGNNFFGNASMEAGSLGMKSVSEALFLRNRLLGMLEEVANGIRSNAEMDICVIGGGPTGVEICGALAEMKKHVFPQDFPGIDFSAMHIRLLEGSDRLLAAMDLKSSERAMNYLTRLGVEVVTGAVAESCTDAEIRLKDGRTFAAGLIVWAAGVKANVIEGLPTESVLPNGRIKTNRMLQVNGLDNVFCIGDQALVEDINYPKGHPQMAQPAIQQGALVASNLKAKWKGKPEKPFEYKDLGSMATVGRNLAVAELKGLKLGGFVAWIIWMAVHLMSIVGVKNRLIIFINWLWSYVTYDQSLRLLIRPFPEKKADK